MSLELEQVGFSYGETTVFAGLDLRLRPGSITVIAGPNGAGKSTLLRVMAGLLTPHTGRVTWQGSPLASLPPRSRAREVALSTEVEEMPFAWTVAEIVLMGRAPHQGSGYLESAADLARATRALEDMDATALAERVFYTLSEGEKQRVLIARALAQETRILLLDEPTSHLDPAHALHLVTLLKRLRKEGTLVVVVVHDLNWAGLLADSLLFLSEGGISAQGPPREVLSEDVVRRVYGVSCQVVGVDPPAIVFRQDPS